MAVLAASGRSDLKMEDTSYYAALQKSNGGNDGEPARLERLAAVSRK